MTITLTIRPEVEADLLAKAQASGMPLEEYLASLIEAVAGSQGKAGSVEQRTREEAVECMLEFGNAHHLSLGEPITRKLFHEGHRY